MAENKTDEVLEKKQLREVMRYWGSGVTVVCAHHEGQNHGMTVSSFTSISLNPALVMIALDRSTRTRQMVKVSEAFAVSILSEAQEEISNKFAGWSSDENDRFDDVDFFNLDSKSPLISGGIGFLDCKVVNTYEVGTHTIFIGEVTALKIVEDAGDINPLMYFNQKYRKLKD